jgi:hypothetical protein
MHGGNTTIDCSFEELVRQGEVYDRLNPVKSNATKPYNNYNNNNGRFYNHPGYNYQNRTNTDQMAKGQNGPPASSGRYRPARPCNHCGEWHYDSQCTKQPPTANSHNRMRKPKFPCRNCGGDHFNDECSQQKVNGGGQKTTQGSGTARPPHRRSNYHAKQPEKADGPSDFETQVAGGGDGNVNTVFHRGGAYSVRRSQGVMI